MQSDLLYITYFKLDILRNPVSWHLRLFLNKPQITHSWTQLIQLYYSNCPININSPKRQRANTNSSRELNHKPNIPTGYDTREHCQVPFKFTPPTLHPATFFPINPLWSQQYTHQTSTRQKSRARIFRPPGKIIQLNPLKRKLPTAVDRKRRVSPTSTWKSIQLVPNTQYLSACAAVASCGRCCVGTCTAHVSIRTTISQ